MLVLSGIAIIVAGFLLRFNPLLVVLVSALATGLAAGMDPLAIVAAFGKAFNDNRYVTAIYMVLPVIGLLERHGLQERARSLITAIRGATAGRLLIFYLIFRQISAAQQSGDETRHEDVAAMAAATDNIGLFFGEDIFIAIGSILLMKGVLEGYGIIIEPLHLSVWAIPTAIAAFLIHGFRLLLLDRRLKAKHP